MNIFLDGRSTRQRIEAAKEFLLEHGYLVRGPIMIRNQVKNSTQLVRFFYDTMVKYRPRLEMVYAGNIKKDRVIAKRLIEARVGLGVSRQRAIAECCEFIIILFQYEDYLGLSFPVTSMSVFGQESMGWVTEKLWHIYEGLNRIIDQEEDQLWFDRIYNEQEKNISDESLVKARDKMDRILERYGKEE